MEYAAPKAEVKQSTQPQQHAVPVQQQYTDHSPRRPQNMTAPQNANPVATVPYKGSGESALFFSDHVEFAGASIRYADISVMDSHAVESRSYALIFWWGDFSGHLRFTLANGYQAKIKVYGFSFWSIGGKKSARNRWAPLFRAAYQITAKAMAAKVTAQILQGATVSLAGIDIRRDGAVCKKLMKRDPIYISKSNFGQCGLDGYNVRIVDKAGAKLFTTSDDAPNALLLPYVLTALFD